MSPARVRAHIWKPYLNIKVLNPGSVGQSLGVDKYRNKDV